MAIKNLSKENKVKEVKFGSKDENKIDYILRNTNHFLKDGTYCNQVKTDLIKMSCSENIEKGVDYSAAMLAYLDAKKQAGYSSCGARKAIRNNLRHHYVRMFKERQLQTIEKNTAIIREKAELSKENSL